MSTKSSHLIVFPFVACFTFCLGCFGGTTEELPADTPGETLAKSDYLLREGWFPVNAQIVRHEWDASIEMVFSIEGGRGWPDLSVDGTLLMTERVHREIEVLDRNEHGPTKIKVRILDDVERMNVTTDWIPGPEWEQTSSEVLGLSSGEAAAFIEEIASAENTTTKDPLVGKTLIGTKEAWGLRRLINLQGSDSEWRFTLEDGQPTPEEVSALDDLGRDIEQLVFDELEYPTTSVSLGDTWVIEEEEGRTSLTLEGVTGDDESGLARIVGSTDLDFTREVPLLGSFNIGGSLTGHHRLDLGNESVVDGEYKGQIQVTASAFPDDPEMTIRIQGAGPVSFSIATHIVK